MIPQAQIPMRKTLETPSPMLSPRRPASRWIAAAATLTLGAAATFGSACVVAQTTNAPPPPPHAPRGPGGWHHHGGPDRPGGELLNRHELDKVGASADQKAKIATIFKSASTDLQPSRDAARASRSRMIDLLAAPTIDRNAIESLRIQEQQLHDTESRRMTQALADAAEVLTPEQRAQIAADVRAREARMTEHMQEYLQKRQDKAASAPPHG